MSRFESGNQVSDVLQGVMNSMYYNPDYTEGVVIDNMPFDGDFLAGNKRRDDDTFISDGEYDDDGGVEDEYISGDEYDDEYADRHPSPRRNVRRPIDDPSRRRRGGRGGGRVPRQRRQQYSDEDYGDNDGDLDSEFSRASSRKHNVASSSMSSVPTAAARPGGSRRLDEVSRNGFTADHMGRKLESNVAAYGGGLSDVPFIDSLVWDPPMWNESRLAQAGFYVTFYGTAREFDQGTKRVDGGTLVNYTMFNITNDDLMVHCRRNGDNEYGSCNRIMRRVVECRQADKSVHPVLIRFKNISNSLPFPVCVIAENAPALNTVRVSIPNKNGRPVSSRAMTVLPASSNVDEELIVDMRRLIADPGMVYFMKLDKEAVFKQVESMTGDLGNEKIGRIRHGREFHKIVQKICKDKNHELRAEALAIKKAILKDQQNGGNKKLALLNKSSATDVGVWHNNIPMHALETIREYIGNKIDSVVKISELSLRIVPVYGEKAWMNPKLWVCREMMNSRQFARIGQMLNKLNARDTDNDKGMSSSSRGGGGGGGSQRDSDYRLGEIEGCLEWDLPTGVSFILDMKFL